MRRTLAVAAVMGTALLAYAAVGNGDIQPTNETTLVTVTSLTGSGSGTATLQNTTSITTYNVLVGSDATCDPAITFSVAGGNPSNFPPSSSRNVQLTCPPRGSAAMRRCLYHATNNINGAALADFMGLCLYGSASPSLTPLQTNLDFGSVSVGEFAQQAVTVRNDSPDQTITRVYLQTTDVDGTFQLADPCNPDTGFCDEELASAIPPGASFTVRVKCRPQSAGAHSAELKVGTNTFQLQSSAITLACAGVATAVPALGVNPTSIAIGSPVDVTGQTASVVVHLENTGGNALNVSDVRIVDVDNGASEDWRYTASGKCSGQISNGCMMNAGDRVAINITFDPTAIGRRRAALLVSFRDTLDRTVEIPLEGIGEGATLSLPGTGELTFGSVPIGRSEQLTFELANDGNRDAAVTLSLAPSTTPPFTLTPASSTTVSPGTPRIVTVTCAPTVPGTLMTTVTAQGTDTLSMTPVMVQTDCEGSEGELYGNPTSLLFGEVRLSAAPVTRTVQLLSAGTPLTLTGQPQLETANPSIVLGTLDQMTTPARFDVTVMPMASGPLAATILVSSTTGETLHIPVTGTAVKASYAVASTRDLGTFCVDQPTTSSNVALVSDGTATIRLTAPALQEVPSPIVLALTTPQVYPHLVAGGAGVVVAVTPKRQQAATSVSDTLVWHTDVAGQLTAATTLSARFIDKGAAVAPPALDFAEVTVHLFSDNGQRVVIQNCNATPLVLDPPMIRTPFSIDSPAFPSMLDPNESVAFSVGFHPTRVGPVSETLRITSPQLPGAPLEVVLTGIGGSGDAVSPDAGIEPVLHEDSHFFACACQSSRPLSGWPLPAVIVLVIVRRRRGASSPR